MGLIRVAQVVRPASGGIRRHVSSLLLRMPRSDFAPVLFAPPDFRLDPAVDALPRVPTQINATVSPVKDLSAILRLSAHLRGQFDLVHAHGIRGALIAIPAARIAGIPALFTAHNLLSPGGRLTTAVLRFLGRNSTIIAVSNAVAETLRARGIGSTPIQIIPNGIELADFEPPIPDEARRRRIISEILEKAVWVTEEYRTTWLRSDHDIDRPLFVVGAVGRLSPEKGFDVLISAFAAWNAQTSRNSAAISPLLVLAGAGPDEARLLELARNVPGVVLAGALTNVAPLLRAADVVAVPSREEGQGIVALEAMAACKPVVATSVGGLPESILDGETGFLVPPSDPEALSAALRNLAVSPALRSQMGARGRERVERSFTLDSMMEQVTALYKKMVSRGS